MAKVQKGAADAAAKLIAKYGRAAVSSAVRNFKPAAKVKVTGSGATGNGRFPKSNVKPSQSKFTGKNNKPGQPSGIERVRLGTPSSPREKMALKYAKEQSNIRKAKKK
jgi:hypothetical protein